MLKLLERTIASLDERLILLAPEARVPGFFQNVEHDPSAISGSSAKCSVSAAGFTSATVRSARSS